LKKCSFQFGFSESAEGRFDSGVVPALIGTYVPYLIGKTEPKPTDHRKYGIITTLNVSYLFLPRKFRKMRLNYYCVKIHLAEISTLTSAL